MRDSFEDYLKQIYELSLDSAPVKTSRLAEAMSVSAASVTEMLKKMAHDGLVEHQPYRGILLTEAGRQAALSVVRRHRLWETFLFEVLGIPWAAIHEHACRLEHATDGDLAESLAKYLEHPTVDPHGDPIPSR